MHMSPALWTWMWHLTHHSFSVIAYASSLTFAVRHLNFPTGTNKAFNQSIIDWYQLFKTKMVLGMTLCMSWCIFVSTGADAYNQLMWGCRIKESREGWAQHQRPVFTSRPRRSFRQEWQRCHPTMTALTLNWRINVCPNFQQLHAPSEWVCMCVW